MAKNSRDFMPSIASRVMHPSCFILDFDGTLLHNPRTDFSLNINSNCVISKDQFFLELATQLKIIHPSRSLNYLITGRSLSQREGILTLLESKGYRFHEAYFNGSIDPEDYSEGEFMRIYWLSKLAKIQEIVMKVGLKQVVIIDDDPVLCELCQGLGYGIVQARIGIENPNHSKKLRVTFTIPQRCTSELALRLLQQHDSQPNTRSMFEQPPSILSR